MGKAYLAATGMDEIWDLGGEVALLGPWCLNDKSQARLAGKKYSCVQNIRYTTDDLLNNAALCEEAYFKALKDLSRLLNQLHGVNKSDDYWSIVLNPWLICHVSIVHERYVRLLDIIKRTNGSLYTHCIDFDPDLVALDNADFMFSKSYSDYYNLQLVSQMAGYLGIECRKIDIKGKDIPLPEGHKSSILKVSKYWLRKAVLKMQGLFLREGNIVMVDMYHLNFLDKLLLNSMLGSITTMDMDFIFWKRDNFEYSSTLRAKLGSSQNHGNPFIDLIMKTIPNTIPRYCIEGYHAISKKADSIKRRMPKLIISSTGWHFNEKFKFYAAQMQEAGARLVGVQHGGNYGFTLYHPFLIFEMRNKYKFLTWGWTDDKNAEKTQVVPVPHLSKNYGKAKADGDFILYVSSNYSKYLHVLIGYPGPDGFELYFKQQFSFLENLSKKLHGKFYYRPYPEDFGRNIKQKVQDIVPGVHFANKGKGIDWAKRARLVIIDTPISAMIEALVLNVPLVLFWDPKLWQMKEESKYYFNLLRTAGVLFDTPETAAAKVDEVYNRAKDWWQQKEIQDARATFIEKYGYAKKDWRKIWIKELSHMCCEFN